jgi:hypothetical protein
MMQEINHTAMTLEGRQWALRALDPFHDTNVGLQGMPDHDTAPSAIQYLRRKVTIKKPAGIISGTWSAHIVSMPTLDRLRLASLDTSISPTLLYIRENDRNAGTVTVITHPDGEASFPDTPNGTTVPTTHQWQAFSVNDDNARTMKKVIAGGFEVHNDTAELYKQGNVGVYTEPQAQQTTGLSGIRHSGTNYHPGGLRRFREPPQTVDKMAVHPSVRNWAAADGCYVPFRLNMADGTEFKPHTSDIPIFAFGDDDTNESNFIGLGGIPNVLAVNDPVDEDYINTYNYWHPAALSTTGAYFSGLSLETVLTLDILFIVEAAPTSANPALLSMVSPTAPYDPIAIRFYCNTLAMLPPGVPVSENAKGDWWRTVVKTGAKVAKLSAPIVAITGHPVAGAAIAAGGELLSLAGRKPKGNIHLTPNNIKRKK